MPRYGGRKSKLTHELTDQLADVLREGSHLNHAAAICEIPRSNVYYWRRQGESDFEAGKDTEHAYFYRVTEKARAEAIHRMVRIIQAAAGGQKVPYKDKQGNVTHRDPEFRAAVEFIKRAAVEEWGTQSTVKVNVQQARQDVLDAVEPHMSQEAYAELLGAVARLTGVAQEEAGAGRFH